MKSVEERLTSLNGLTLQKLRLNGITTTDTMSEVINTILGMGDTAEAKESFILLRDHLEPAELAVFSGKGVFAFIIKVGEEITEPDKKGIIEAVWTYSDSGRLTENKKEAFAKAISTSIFGVSDNYQSIITNSQNPNIVSMFQTVNSTQELISNMVEAKLKPVEEMRVPEQRMSMLERLVDSFIKFISELVAGKAEVKEEPVVEKEKTPMELLSEKANPWSDKVVSKEETPLER